MKKYVMFCSSAPHWLELAKDLKENKIAEPELWLSDDIHFKEACSFFGRDKVKMLSELRYQAPSHQEIYYDGSLNNFFLSEEYISVKDICIKMMDRLDEIGMMSRLDKETWFHFVCIWTLKRFSKNQPHFVVMSEPPHNHAQYLVFSLCNYLKIPILSFSGLLPIPTLFPYIFSKGKYNKLRISQHSSSKSKLTNALNIYIDDTYARIDKNNGVAPHLEELSEKSKSIKFWAVNKIKLFKDTFRFLKYPKKMFANKYESFNPFGFNAVFRYYFSLKKSSILFREFKSQIYEDFKSNNPYIFFPLHYEPERTTLPDGGEFQDQFKLICTLRDFFPSNYNIVVKEHPSQFLSARIGSQGRSPLFYSLLNNVNNLIIVSNDSNTQDLIKNAQFVATISGTVGFEAALIGKKVILFGEAWFKGMPNVETWERFKNKNFKSIKKSNNINNIKSFFEHEIIKSGIVGFQNLSSKKRFSKFLDNEYYKDQKSDLFNAVKQFIINYVR